MGAKVNKIKRPRSFWYILILTILSAGLIFTNAILGMVIPFHVSILIGFILLLLVFVFWDAYQRYGLRTTLLMLGGTYLAAFTAEMLGVNFGLIFGEYYYTERLGIQILGVPLLAGTAWGPITYAAYHLSCRLWPFPDMSKKPFSTRLFVHIFPSFMAALAATAWDLVIDPIAVADGWWIWVGGGRYLPSIKGGIPNSNFIGWIALSFLIQMVYRMMLLPHENHSKTIDGPVILYISLYLTSIGVALTVTREGVVAVIGAFCMGIFIFPILTNKEFLSSIGGSHKIRKNK